MSLTIVVPEAVPSLFQSSSPWPLPSSAANRSVESLSAVSADGPETQEMSGVTGAAVPPLIAQSWRDWAIRRSARRSADEVDGVADRGEISRDVEGSAGRGHGDGAA